MAKRKPRNTLGFGFDPTQSPHHFTVVAPRGEGEIVIEERFTWGDDNDAQEAAPDASLKAVLDTYRWARLAPTVAEVFNARLRAAELPTANWTEETLLAPHLGKEVTLLFWATEEADATLLPAMLANWVGLAPEERWWLYTTINATSGHPEYGRNRGWRKAIKIAFAENPIVSAAPSALYAEPSLPVGRRPARRRGNPLPPNVETDQLSLF